MILMKNVFIGKSAPYFVYYTDNYATLQIIYACPEFNGVKADTRMFN